MHTQSTNSFFNCIDYYSNPFIVSIEPSFIISIAGRFGQVDLMTGLISAREKSKNGKVRFFTIKP